MFVSIGVSLSGCGEEPVSRAKCLRAGQGVVAQEEFLNKTRARARTWLPTGDSHLLGGIVFVSGVDGGFQEPADGIYEDLARYFADQGVGSVFVEYRRPGDLEPSVDDAEAALQFLATRGAMQFALVGWSFGGAVIANMAARSTEVMTVIGFAAQARYTQAIQDFKGRSILLIHDVNDENVPFEAMGQILDEVPPQVRSRTISTVGSNHFLDEKKQQLLPEVRSWLATEFSWTNCPIF